MTLSLSDLDNIVSNGDFSRLLSQHENQFFDAKSQVYVLDKGKATRELIKDVTAFANAGGGYIVLGVQTEKSTATFGDVVTSLAPFSQTLVDPKSYAEAIEAGTYPGMTGVSVKWHHNGGDDPDRGHVVIHVPAQDAGHKPFLMRKSFDEESQKAVEILFGVSERRSDQNTPLKLEHLHRFIQLGMAYERQIAGRFSDIEAVLGNVLAERMERDARRDDTQLLNERVEQAISHEYLGGPVFCLAIMPYPRRPLKTWFQTREGSLRSHLESADSHRPHGWNLHMDSGQSKVVSGDYLRRSDRNKVVDLYRDGTMVLAADVDESYLKHATRDRHTINSIGLIETVVSVMDFYPKVIADAGHVPLKLVLRAQFFGMRNGIDTILRPYWPMSRAQEYGTPPDDTMVKEVEVLGAEFDPTEAAFTILSEIYLWFGLDPGSQMPAAQFENGKPGRISTDQLLSD